MAMAVLLRAGVRRALVLGAAAWTLDLALLVTCLLWVLGVPGLGYPLLALSVLAAAATAGFVTYVTRRLRWVLRAFRSLRELRAGR